MKKIIWFLLLSVFSVGFIFPEIKRIPVRRATPANWNSQSFWYFPWGYSGTHKGIAIFALLGTPIVAATSGLILRITRCALFIRNLGCFNLRYRKREASVLC